MEIQNNNTFQNSPDLLNRSMSSKMKKFMSWVAAIAVLVAVASGSFYMGRRSVSSGTSSNKTPTQPQSATVSNQKSAVFDAKTDALVKDFQLGKVFGGKYGVAQKSVSYTVFFPEGFGFNKQSDRLQLLYGMATDKMADDTGSNNNKTCTAVSGGLQCVVTWTFNEQELQEGEYKLTFKVLDGQTHQKGKIYIALSGDLKVESVSTVNIKKPLTAPFVLMSGVDDLVIYDKKTATDGLVVSVTVNQKNNPVSAQLIIDDAKVQEIATPEVKDNADYDGSRVAVYRFTISKDTLSALSVGNHSLVAKVQTKDATTQAVTSDDKSGVTIAVK